MPGILLFFLVSLSLLLDLKQKKMEKRGDSSYLMDVIVLDFIVYCIYCIELCLLSVLAADLIETHIIPETFTCIPVTWCPASTGLLPGE